MGADANAKQTICSKTAALLTSKSLSVDAEMLHKEDSTIPIAKAIELVNKCSDVHTHEEELKQCREVGSKIPVIMNSEIGTDPNYKFTFVWFNTLGFILLHIIGISGAMAAFLGYCRVYTGLYCEYSDRIDLMIIFNHFIAYSTVANLCSRPRRYHGCSSFVESSRLQSQTMAQNLPALHAHARRSKLPLGLGSRSSSAPQVQVAASQIDFTQTFFAN
jgi:hypothetical protein